MNYRKIVILPALFVFSHVIYIGCCKCPEVTEAYYEVLGANVRPLGSGNNPIDNGVVATVDTIYLNFSFNIKCIAQKATNFSFLVNSAYACSCAGCGEKGLKSRITNFQISSDTIYSGIPAHQSLNALFKVKRRYYLNEDYSIDSLVKALNIGYSQLWELSLFTKTKPGNNAAHKLKLTIDFANGSTASVATNHIRWQ
jgi:hypothetical protein